MVSVMDQPSPAASTTREREFGILFQSVESAIVVPEDQFDAAVLDGPLPSCLCTWRSDVQAGFFVQTYDFSWWVIADSIASDMIVAGVVRRAERAVNETA